jgi:hypothetical protein
MRRIHHAELLEDSRDLPQVMHHEIRSHIQG